MPAELLAGCCGTGWNPKDPVALGTDYRCCSEGMWRDRMEHDGRPVGLLATQPVHGNNGLEATADVEVEAVSADAVDAVVVPAAGRPTSCAATTRSRISSARPTTRARSSA
jgi:hypothetical protein